jgi:hypothetical protein
MWHQTGMAETKKSSAAVAMGRLDYSSLFAGPPSKLQGKIISKVMSLAL